MSGDSLFRIALLALKHEDHQLFGLLRKANADYSKVSHGLAYWLYETTLVYLIFKSWIPFGEVKWDCSNQYKGNPRDDKVRDYENGNPLKCDLVLKKTGSEFEYYFEAKWWLNMQNKILASLNIDLDRLRKNTDSKNRFLLTFWWSTETTKKTIKDFWNEDIDEIINVNKGECLDAGIDSVYYLGAFPTRCVISENKKGKAYFAMAAIKAK
jgi:hypothetical protein